MSKQIFSSNSSLPFSSVVAAGGLAYVSGQAGIGPDGKVVSGGIEEQTRMTLQNLQATLELAGLSLSNVIRTGCYLTNPSDMAGFSKVYNEFFLSDKPARSTVFVTSLPAPGTIVEIDAVAAIE